jgi:uncharacterized membrane protein YsdA (DUF1294 family)
MSTIGWMVMSWYALASLATFVAFALDKRAASLGGWRTPERTLHVLEAIGGWPGAVAAMLLIRHKNRKLGYLLLTTGIIGIHVAVWAWLLARGVIPR